MRDSKQTNSEVGYATSTGSAYHFANLPRRQAGAYILKIIVVLILVCSTFSGWAQNTNIAVQSNHVEGATYAVIDNERQLLVTYGYMDKTLKFWNQNTGFLYKTIDMPSYVSDLEVNTQKGITYVLMSNTIVLYDNTTFEEIKRYALGRIYTMTFHEIQRQGMLLLYAQNQDGKAEIYGLNEETGEFQGIGSGPYPGEGEVNHMSFTKNNKYFWVGDNYQEHYLYNLETGESYSFKGTPLALFENGDLLFVTKVDNTHIDIIRWDVRTGAAKWTYNQVVEDYGDNYTPYLGQVAMNPDQSTFWIAPSKSTFLELDSNAGFVLGKIYRDESKRAMITDGTYLYAQSGTDKPYAKFKAYDKVPVVEFGSTIFDPSVMTTAINAENAEIVVANFDGDTYSLLGSNATTFLTKYNKPADNGYFSGTRYVAAQQSKKVLSIPGSTSKIYTFERGKPNSFKAGTRSSNNVSGVSYNESKEVLAIAGGGTFRVIDMATSQDIYIKAISQTVLGEQVISISPKEAQVAMLLQEQVGDELSDFRVEYIDYETKQTLWEKKERYSYIKHINQGNQLFAIQTQADRVDILDATSGAVSRSFTIQDAEFGSSFALSPDERSLVVAGYQKPTNVFDTQNGKLLGAIQTSAEFAEMQFLTNTQFAIASDGAIRVYDINTGKEAFRIYIFEDKEWLIHTPEGYFDGSQNAWKRVVFSNQNTIIPLENVFQNFYTPRLLHKLVRQEDIERRDDIDDLKPAPSVQISYKEGTRGLTVEDDVAITTKNGSAVITLAGDPKGDRITEFRLFHNGKRVSVGNRNLTVEDNVPVGASKAFSISLLPGDNTFTAIAVNSQQTESATEQLLVNYTPEQNKLPVKKGMQLHLMIVGIDAYKNPKYNLNYAVADASSFKEAIDKGIGQITTSVNTYVIYNDEAVKGTIEDRFREITEKANPQDIFIFYYAGHGVVTQDADKEFYIVPHNVTQLYGADESLKNKGISATRLKQIAANIPAQKQLYILDACQSAGALSTVASRGAAEEKAIAQLARSTGTHWLTASGSEQFATEFAELGHGVFTYALLEALSGKADSGDKRITVNEIKAYIESRVPEISEKYKGSPQYPSSFGFGQDFPVSISN